MAGLKRFKTTLLEKERLTPSTWRLRFSTPGSFAFLPGQFITFHLDLDRRLPRSYSIASLPEEAFVDLVIKNVKGGRASPYLCGLEEGAELNAIGPLGHFFAKDESVSMTFVATGTGVTPYASMVPWLLRNGYEGRLRLVAGYRTEEEVLYDALFEQLSKEYANFSYDVAVSRPKEGEGRYVQDVVEEQNNWTGTFYLCGLWEMIQDVAQHLAAQDVGKDRIVFERYN